MSLYRKYRPQNFENLVGQDHVRITLSNALKLNKVSHAYLFTGPRGTGKTSTARILAKAVNCLNLRDAKPCEECEICKDISEGRLIDVIEIDAASNRGIDEMRDLREKINFSPTRARSKVYIIDEVHMLTKEAFNALLKTLEEPPSHVYFILATTEVHKIPETIVSRCLRFDFKRIDDTTMVDRLKFIALEEKIDAEEKALHTIAQTAQGGLRDAIGLFEQLSTEGKLTFDHVCNILGLSGYASIEKLFELLQEKNVKNALDEIHQLYSEGYDLHQFNKNFLEHLRRKMLEYIEKGKTVEVARILQLVNFFQEAYEQFRFATIPQLPLEMAVVQSCLGPAMMNESEVEAETAFIKDPKKAHSEDETPSVSSMSPSSGDIPHPRAHKSLEPKEKAPESRPLTFELVTKEWPRLLDHIKTPVVKRSFQQGLLSKVEGNAVTVSFSTKFQMDKTMEQANRTELEKAFADVFQVDVKIIGELKPFAKEATIDDDVAHKVADFFEGEVV